MFNMFNLKEHLKRREFIRLGVMTALGVSAGAVLWRKLKGGATLIPKRLKSNHPENVAGAERTTGTKESKGSAVGHTAQVEVPPDYIEVEVSGVVTDKLGEPVVLLVDRASDKYLPIWIGPSEALAIAMALSNRKPSRPMTHDLLNTVIKALEGEVLRVVIHKLVEGTYYANIVLKGKGKEKVQEIDARPSDSIALALRAKAPIYVTPQISELMEPISEGKEGLRKT
ncbi:MAG: hypothetical protein RUDDFDWM_000137 [Candidatus Fervidibacterota bacterium]